MYIEKYTAFIKDTTTKKSFKLIVEENTPQDAHKKVYNRLNYYQNILKLEDLDKNIVFDIDKGFINN